MRVEGHGAFVLIALIVNAGAALAHSGATGIVKERMMSMKSVAASTKALARLDWSNLEAARDIAAKEAGNIAEHAERIVALFPEGSTQKPTEAGDRIWSEPGRFQQIADDLAESARSIETIAPAATGAADIEAQFKRLAATCKSCHADFRVKR